MKQIFTLARLTALTLGLALLGACGNKGALFIPEPPAEAQTAPATDQ